MQILFKNLLAFSKHPEVLLKEHFFILSNLEILQILVNFDVKLKSFKKVLFCFIQVL
jgi:hypothetical protein